MRVVTRSEEDTAAAARRLAGQLKPGAFLALTGDLGAGKTAFTRGLAAGLGVRRDILSPTFTILRQYTDGRLPLYHFDVYRIGSEDELEDTGFFDAAHADGITVCEWADLIEEAIPEERIDVHITAQDDGSRVIEIAGLER